MDWVLKLLPGGGKSVIGGVGMIALAIAGIAYTFTNPENVNAMPIGEALQLLFAGLAALGIAHKAQRILDKK